LKAVEAAVLEEIKIVKELVEHEQKEATLKSNLCEGAPISCFCAPICAPEPKHALKARPMVVTD
jgi:hypothetical protein